MPVTLSQLIDQVRKELLMPRQAGTPEAMYPFLFVDEVELELNVSVSTAVEGSGKLAIYIIDVGGSSERSNEQSNRITVKLLPLLSREEVREQLKSDARTWERIVQVAMPATTKEGGMAGSE